MILRYIKINHEPSDSPRLGYSKLSPGGLPPIGRPPERLFVPPTGQRQPTVGHEAFASASVWLENVAREGKRVGDRQTAEPVVYKGHVPLEVRIERGGEKQCDFFALGPVFIT